jgi:hypothetical protein
MLFHRTCQKLLLSLACLLGVLMLTSMSLGVTGGSQKVAAVSLLHGVDVAHHIDVDTRHHMSHSAWSAPGNPDPSGGDNDDSQNPCSVDDNTCVDDHVAHRELFELVLLVFPSAALDDLIPPLSSDRVSLELRPPIA